MKMLLDTHSFLWFISGNPKLSPTARTLIENPINQPWLFGISQGHSIGIPNLLGPWRDNPQQVGDSGSLSMPTPKDPQPFLSMASLWEMAIKLSIGKLHLGQPFEKLIPQQMQRNGIEILNIEVDHVAVVAQLPFHHRDLFDRLLVAQTIVEQIPIVSADDAFDAYNVKLLW